MNDEEVETELANVEALTLRKFSFFRITKKTSKIELRGTASEMKSEDDIAMLAGETEDDAIKAAYETSKEDEKFKNLFKGLFLIICLIKSYSWLKVLI